MRCVQSNSMVAIIHERSLDFLDATPDRPKKSFTCLEGRWGHQAIKKFSVYPNSTRDEAAFSCIGSRDIVHSPANMTSGLNSFRQLEKFPKNPVKCPEKPQIQHSNSKKAPCTPKPLGKIEDYLTSTK